MESLKFIAVFVLILTLLVSCSKEADHCTFVINEASEDGLFDEMERAIINDCSENSFLSKSEIESNLIGEWELTGYAVGWFATVTQPCGYIVISEDQLTFKYEDAYTKTHSTHGWTIEGGVGLG